MLKKILVSSVLGISLITSGCSTMNNPKVTQSATLGAVLGGTTGALLDKHNRWRGGAIGAAIGAAALGGAVAIEEQAITENRPVTVTQGNTVTRVEPVPSSSKRTSCRKVRKRVWKDGKLVSDTIEEICKSEKEEDSY